jgi:hypothetical protein
MYSMTSIYWFNANFRQKSRWKYSSVFILIKHVIPAKYSIDRIDVISNRLNISKEQIPKILRADRYKDYFQLLKNRNHGTEEIALTLDVSFWIKRNHMNKVND